MNKVEKADYNARLDLIKSRLKMRYAKEKAFRALGIAAIAAALLMLVILFVTIIGSGYTAFQQTFVQLEINFDRDKIDPDGTGDMEIISQADYGGIVKKTLRGMFP